MWRLILALVVAVKFEVHAPASGVSILAPEWVEDCAL